METAPSTARGGVSLPADRRRPRAPPPSLAETPQAGQGSARRAPARPYPRVAASSVTLADSPGVTGLRILRLLADVLDSRRWDDLPALLHKDFACRYRHTGEEFDCDGWVRLNADYPGFQHFVLEDCVGSGDRAAGRAHVTGMADGQLQHFGVASFVTVRDGLIAELTEVWTDIGRLPPEGHRPN
jgi:hypothetical protein